MRLGSPAGRHWIPEYAYRTSGMKNALTLLTDKKSIGCELYLSGSLATSRFDVPAEYRESIDAACGAELDWQRLPDRIACCIKATVHIRLAP